MNNKYFKKERLSKKVASFVNLVGNNIALAFKAVFVKRTILLVTNRKITTINLTPMLQLMILAFFVWVGAIFAKSLSYNHIINVKSQEISELKTVNGYFKQQFDDVNKKLLKVNEYLIFVTGSQVQKVNAVDSDFEHPESIKEQQNLSKGEIRTLNSIKDANNMISTITLRADDRIKNIEDAIAVTGLNVKKFALNRQVNKIKNLASTQSNVKEISLNQNGELAKAQGGPLIYKDGKAKSKNFQFASVINEADFANQIDYLEALENLVKLMPLNKPMKNFYISSGFGYRIDPITKSKALHPGVDFAGAYKAPIISPSIGKVVFAGRKNGYGNAVIISHGYKITTLYGHLSEIKVRVGQAVKKGEVIAIQGSTGRSTGDHLHYEVRYRNIPLNPKNFLEAGEKLINDQSLRYVSS